MYFGKSEFVPDVEMAEEAQRDAQEAVWMAVTYYSVTLDGTVDSIRGIDEILDQLHRMVSASELPQEMASRCAEIFGSYFGERLRLAQGATCGLEQIYRDRMPALYVGPSGIVINPLRWADERIVAGMGRNLWTYYETIVRSIQAPETRGFAGV